MNENFVLVAGRSRWQADGVKKPIKGSVEALVEAIEQRVLAWREGCVTRDRAQGSGSQGSIDALEEVPKEQADGIALGQQMVAARAGQLFDKAFPAELGEVVSKRGQGVLLGGWSPGRQR